MFTEKEMSDALKWLFDLFQPEDYEAYDEEEVGCAALCLPEVCMALRDKAETAYEYNALLKQEEKEAHHVATALEIYVKGSLKVFNHRTNVDIQNRLVCYDIKELGNQLKKIGMLVVQDQVWGRVTQNRNAGKSTRYYSLLFCIGTNRETPSHKIFSANLTHRRKASVWKMLR